MVPRNDTTTDLRDMLCIATNLIQTGSHQHFKLGTRNTEQASSPDYTYFDTARGKALLFS